ncbi:PPR domain-containing protein/PPR_2 domain-containing protein [Cephalotus follicularis]|uniref:PPR domain-containing protein/PPR_2 domain-containing protein n=1 Tax=Cephalotus follicularis TaxID=3775 RepID=A0A1Q3CFQ6_CEPFO|nr:PPR domain-containing protein/PPR_2 domain-containing protein [Cephalotus follicularis]
MKLLLVSFHQIPKNLTPLSQLLLSLKPYSSTTTYRETKWNSATNVIITHPTLSIMESCTSMRQLKQIQAHMTPTGLISHTFPVSRVLSFCALAHSGDINHAHFLFTQIQNPNTYIWNTMIRGYTKAQNPKMGFLFFRRMIEEHVEMDSRSFVFALKACSKFLGVLEGKTVHCNIWKMGFISDLLVQNGVIHFYADGGWVSFARQVFDESSVRDVFSWTSMIDGYAAHDCSNEALDLFDLMLLSDAEPNEVTMVAVISACSQIGDLRVGKSIHAYIKKKIVNFSLNLQNALLDLYVKCGCLNTAMEIFNKMEMRDVFSWTSMVNGYAKYGELDYGRRLFNEMPERNVVSWNAMIAGYSQNSRPKEALELFHDMLKAGFAPMGDSLACVLSACGQLGCLDLGLWIQHYYINENRIKLSVILANAFIDMFAKCGVIDAAAKLFNGMSQRNLVSWNSMIAAYAAHGEAKEALILFERMKSCGLKPDDITFVGILSACSHGGLISEGLEIFENMEKYGGVEPKGEHYACMIDLFGRTGLLEEAYELIKKMPMKPSEAAWGAILNACRMHGNVEMAKLAANKLLHLDPEDSGIYVLLASICAKGRRWGDVGMFRSMMRERRIKKMPGCSSIEVEGEFHEFSVADVSHPLSKEIYKVLNEVTLQCFPHL